MKLAILGGSFNPVHIGHLVLAQEVCTRLGYDKVLFVPANLPPHKELAAGASAGDRLEMVNRAVADNPLFAVDDCELRRGGISYSYDTLAYLEDRYAAGTAGSLLAGKIGLIMGDDLVAGFDSWKCAAELADRADLILARRLIQSERGQPVFSYRHTELQNAVLPVSSSDIRNGIRNSAEPHRRCDLPFAGGWRYLVPDAVYRYIIQRKLYGYGIN
ncbi:nicotinate (nicotinamide) nucleotide adenylyltransferase [Treponema brennaborense]|uniref:Probable nicotinate-nucleotide adenylyltransferase n=1 Tax=Treponema brennaborense (strain DSM 12168 / CIP 105900 / DD5/3) TaxID=906968 RepID=F4LQJ0_TREBD|nr:nicotinate (nicotinamide) nucleotide adenylyltransferase [Treponema brennaborense]AEE17199.1 nicotinate-nucleotide adenylyltransferase [Treponema brennaborense DSM 12168]